MTGATFHGLRLWSNPDLGHRVLADPHPRCHRAGAALRGAVGGLLVCPPQHFPPPHRRGKLGLRLRPLGIHSGHTRFDKPGRYRTVSESTPHREYKRLAAITTAEGITKVTEADLYRTGRGLNLCPLCIERQERDDE
jgi:hypothetical protein